LDFDWEVLRQGVSVILIVVVCCCLSSADLNRDGSVNGADLDIMLSQWGESGSADLNRDGVVSSGDLKMILDDWT
jgi:hypothetical protein